MGEPMEGDDNDDDEEEYDGDSGDDENDEEEEDYEEVFLILPFLPLVLLTTVSLSPAVDRSFRNCRTPHPWGQGRLYFPSGARTRWCQTRERR